MESGVMEKWSDGWWSDGEGSDGWWSDGEGSDEG